MHHGRARGIGHSSSWGQRERERELAKYQSVFLELLNPTWNDLKLFKMSARAGSPN